ncbi:MAG: DNA-protecting protein DprA [Cyanobacteria bacterium]|jgi:DNA processing protein|nr:DNA-protecting protein DprA [Cyanobacteria bacterium GSL.Bin21]
MTSERAYWLAWSQISGVGAVTLQRLQHHFPSLEAAWKANQWELQGVTGIGKKNLQPILEQRSRLTPEQILVEHEAKNPQFWTPADTDYPRLLLETPTPPPVLYYRGKINAAEMEGTQPLISIVGTRSPSDYGRKWTKKITTALVKHGYTIVSGLAAGIDAIAHQSCLDAGGRTLAVLGTGLDITYPQENRQLYQQVEQQGAILTEYPIGTKPDRGNFPARNRIVAGLSRAVIVTEAPEKSGALITARYANEFGRDVYVLPGSLDNKNAIGCLGLLNHGANVILSEGHLLEMLGTMPQLDLFEETPPSLPEMAPELKELLSAMAAPVPNGNIAPEPTAFDVIVQAVSQGPNQVAAGLLELELLGLISQVPGMRYQRLQ